MMLTSYTIIILSLILIFQAGICWCQFVLKFSVDEEKKLGSFVGNINNYVMSHFNEYQHYEVSMMNNYFEILPNKDLVIKKRIDLETFCSESNLCCDTSLACRVKFPVLINSANTQRNQFEIEVEVIDINDNKPTFKNPIQTVSFPENSDINYSVAIDGGSDNDFTANNQIISYSFKESSMTFSLENIDMALSIVLRKSIDFERQNVYNGKLSACDTNIRCVDQPIVINIGDVNDNFPTFEKAKYEVEIKENFEVNKVVVSTRAIDLDGAQFNKTKYGFLSNRDTIINSKFKVGLFTGEIILKSKLIASQRAIYKFRIYAVDAKAGGKRDFSDIVIKVLDINDNKPSIELYQSQRITNDKEVFEMKIQENERAQKLMTIKVTDADLGQNAKVYCELLDHTSSLELKHFDTIYEIHSLRKFDYEQETEIRATFKCKDGGTPQLMSSKSIKINIEDVNESPPVFDQSEFHGSVQENRGPGEVVLTVRAVDQDGGAVLTYSIEDAATQYFAINPTTGVIKTASVPFDREQTSSKSFRVTVTDAVSNAKSSDAMVRISILDENDNEPVFVPTTLVFSIAENEQPKTRLKGQVYATDADQDHGNKFVTFGLIDVYDSELRKCERPYFLVKANGDMEALSLLDRETNPNFTVTIEARDGGVPVRSVRANATVTVTDVNDNPPQWIYPRHSETARRSHINPQLPMLNLTVNTEPFILIMKLKAYDPDENEAGRVSYILVNHQSLFSLNESTGELRTVRSPLPFGQYQLQLRATDHGSPSRNSDSWMLINIEDNDKLTTLNLTIIIGMVTITALISVFLIIAIVCVRRRPRLQQSYMAPQATELSKDHQSSQYFNQQNQWMMYQPSDIDPTMPDNDSCIYVPSGNFYEQQDPLILHSLVGSRPASRLDYPLVLPSSHPGNTQEQKFGSQSITQNGERTAGTLRSNTGHYYTIDAPSSGIMINGQELDGDSADSGKGASEVDLRLQYHLNNGTRNYPTMPFPHHSTASSLFGYPTNMHDPNYYPTNQTPKSFDSRFLTVNASNVPGKRRVVSPKFNSNSQCQCFMLPEDDIIQVGGRDPNHVPMTTFSQQPATNHHDHNCVYRDDIGLVNPGTAFYSACPYNQGPSSRVSNSPIPFTGKDSLTNTQEMSPEDNAEVDRQMESYSNNNNMIFEGQKKNNYSGADQVGQETNLYSLGMAT